VFPLKKNLFPDYSLATGYPIRDGIESNLSIFPTKPPRTQSSFCVLGAFVGNKPVFISLLYHPDKK
jgi:hypothetical protein